eukprot:TRINITY_DN5965_c0_g1_i2.p1 TRINITY_DN5965_c0_g1~~TRINITY_DN5965_c0_g1_i2.p1  ORF type:complete len:155 (+),score=25.33 TRINITY_DN5965_c0_g1_i2:96-560(+)
MALLLVVAVSLGVATAGIVGRSVVRHGSLEAANQHYRRQLSANLPPTAIPWRAEQEEIATDDDPDFLRPVEDPKSQFSGGFEEKMPLEEAQYILGLTDEDMLNERKLTSAHRRIMARNHPDRGGSLFLASKINEAKAVLIPFASKPSDSPPKKQ